MLSSVYKSWVVPNSSSEETLLKPSVATVMLDPEGTVNFFLFFFEFSSVFEKVDFLDKLLQCR